MIAFIVSLAQTKIGRCLIGLAIIGFFILGFRIWLPIHDASVAREARAGYVSLQEKLAAEATVAEMTRQRNAAQQATEEHRRRLEAARAQQATAEASLENEIRSYELQLSEKNRQCLADTADVDWLLRH